MRYIPVNQLKENMVLGQELFNASGKVLLEKHTILTDENISYIAFLSIPGVYVDDEFSKEAQIQEVIVPEVKRAAVAIVKDVFVKSEDGTMDPEEERIKAIVEEIINNILDNKDVMANLLELKTYDDYTFFHSANVAVLSGVIGAKCNISDMEMEALVTAGFLHDIGKIFIKPEIINAPRKLTETEKTIMQDHPRLGFDLLINKFHFDDIVTRAVYEHHEWVNGEGYPRRVARDHIMFISKILRAADVYDAMTSSRPYHSPFLPSEVMEYIMGRTGLEFDARVVRTMSKELCIFPVGCEVELSDGAHGIVVENHRGFVMRPTIKIIPTGEIVDLCEDRSKWKLVISRLLM